MNTQEEEDDVVIRAGVNFNGQKVINVTYQDRTLAMSPREARDLIGRKPPFTIVHKTLGPFRFEEELFDCIKPTIEGALTALMQIQGPGTT
jgi:hypothetical protein